MIENMESSPDIEFGSDVDSPPVPPAFKPDAGKDQVDHEQIAEAAEVLIDAYFNRKDFRDSFYRQITDRRVGLMKAENSELIAALERDQDYFANRADGQPKTQEFIRASFNLFDFSLAAHQFMVSSESADPLRAKLAERFVSARERIIDFVYKHPNQEALEKYWQIFDAAPLADNRRDEEEEHRTDRFGILGEVVARHLFTDEDGYSIESVPPEWDAHYKIDAFVKRHSNSNDTEIIPTQVKCRYDFNVHIKT